LRILTSIQRIGRIAGISSAIIIGGTKGIGLMLAEIMATRGDKVTIAGRDPELAAAAARKIGPNVTGIAVDLAPDWLTGAQCDRPAACGADDEPWRNVLFGFAVVRRVGAGRAGSL
jgi:NAD(P)-dependent dehydrogenase (short-subunit alcohol dehydrogenase family)